jgi:hypothetical protein
MRLKIFQKSQAVDNWMIRTASRFYINELMGKDHQDIGVEVKFNSKLLSKKGFRGTVTWTDNRQYPRKFQIEIDSRLSKKQTLLTLAHEFVHVKQYVYGELRDSSDCKHVNWRGRSILVNDDNIREYYTSPWEIDAFGRAHGLYEIFIFEKC